MGWGLIAVIASLCIILAYQIREKQKLHQQLQKLGDELKTSRSTTDNITASIMLSDQDGTIRYCSRYTEVMTGYSLEEIATVGSSFIQTIMHDEYKSNYDRALQFFAAGEPFSLQHRFRHRSGIDIWAETRTTPIFDDQGHITALLAVTINISQQMVYQRQVEIRTKEVEDFTYMVSHDLKAPIFTLKGMTTILEEQQAELPSSTQEIVYHISRAAKRLEQLVTSVLEYAKITSTRIALEPVSLDQTIRDVAANFAVKLAADDINLSTTDTLPVVSAEPMRLLQVFSNLVDNAIKYRDPCRPLTIEIGALPQNSTRFWTIYVADTGGGIPADRVNNIFRPFYRAHGSEIEGTGIGLACVKKLLEKCGGDIEVESESGKGSTFFLTFKVPSPSYTSEGT